MPPVIGLDFGTTNSAIAVADACKEATLASFGDGSKSTSSFRSILYFPLKDRSSTAKAETKAGPEAINSYLEAIPRDDSFSPLNPTWRVVCSHPHKSTRVTTLLKI